MCSTFEANTTFRSMDIIGNIYKTKEHSDRIYGKGGRLLENGNIQYKYDELGNITQKINGDKTWIYQYYENGLMSKAICSDGKTVLFKYDALGRRIEKSFNGTSTKFLWDGNMLLHEWKETNNIKEYPITWIFKEDGFTPSAKITDRGVYSILTNHLGTPIEMYNETGKSIWKSDFDIYGKTINQEGQYDSCLLRFPGQYEDEETGLYYNRFRYYSPEDGIYTQQDPIGLDGGNPTIYGYVYDTLNHTDYFGLNTDPSLPPKVLFQKGNTTIEHLYHGIQEHANPIHYHVYDNSSQIAKVNSKGTVLSGKLNKNATDLLSQKSTTSKLQKMDRKISNYIRKMKDSIVGSQPFRPGEKRSRKSHH